MTPRLPLPPFALAVTGVAGAVDAIGFLHFHTFYVSFMSGNTTRVAVALAEGDGSQALRGMAIIGVFLGGIVVGDLLTGDPPRRMAMTLLVEAFVVGAAAIVGPGIGSSLLLAAAMGMHNALVLRAGGIGVALTYVTGTLVHFGRAVAAWLAGRRSDSGPAYAASWLALFAGALAGGATARWSEAVALTAIAVVLILLAAVSRASTMGTNKR